jgi:hypothetical protein
MPELSDAVEQKTEQILSKDLECLLDVGFALRSVPEDEMVRWLKGEDILVRPERPCKNEVRYTGQPVFGITKEYDVVASSGLAYRFVVHPRTVHGINSNEVKVKFSKAYAVGENPDPGELVKPASKDVFYLLPLVAKLPLKDISYKQVAEFLEKHNGFVYDVRRPEVARFYDSYVQVRFIDSEDPLVSKSSQTRVHWRAEKVWMDVYLSVYNVKQNEVRLDLELVIPKKDVA